MLIATRNAHKTREFAEMLGAGFAVEDLRAHPEIGEVIEDGTTFLENARLKALAASRHWRGLVLADDSGLEVESLGGAPGVYSARYAGPEATDAENRRKLIAAIPSSDFSRGARFRCLLVLAEAGKTIADFEGAVEGKIIHAERGEAGFGYDRLFQPDGCEKTFAELSASEKNVISHRAAAVANLRTYLSEQTLPEEGGTNRTTAREEVPREGRLGPP